MSNPYIHCCAEIEAITQEEMLWLTNQLSDVTISPDHVSGQTLRSEDVWTGPRFLCEELNEDGEMIHEQGFNTRFVEADGNCRLIITADEGFAPYTLVVLVHKFLRKFRPTECWGTTYAEGVDKDIPDAFSGGFVFVTARGYLIKCAHERLTELTGKHQLERTQKTAWEEVEDLNRRMEEAKKAANKHWVWGGFDPTNLPQVPPRNAADPQAPETPPEG